MLTAVDIEFSTPWNEPKQSLLTEALYRQDHTKFSPVLLPGPISSSKLSEPSTVTIATDPYRTLLPPSITALTGAEITSIKP